MIRYRLYGSLPVNGIKKAFDAICVSTFNCLKLCEELEFDVNIVNKKMIKSINKKYRKIDRFTDVISFANRDSKDIYVPLIGEIFLCYDVAKQQAKNYKHSIQRELIFLFTHGLLHLLGFDHKTKKQEEQMSALTNKIINKAHINRKYIIK